MELTAEEKEIIRKYRRLSEHDKRYIDIAFEALERGKRDGWKLCKDETEKTQHT